MRIGIVAARFNEELTDEMVAQAEERIEETGHEHVVTVRVAGAYDTPLPCQTMLAREDVDGVVALGAVITGETDHDQVLMQATCRTLQALALAADKPVSLGITGPGMTYTQAKARVHYAARAIDALVEQVEAINTAGRG